MANQAMGTYQLAEVPPAAIHWIWPGRIARGAITILESDPGTGKGLIAMDIAARITRGAPFPGQTGRKMNGQVLLCSTEDSATVTQRARAESAGAVLTNIICMAPMIKTNYQGGMAAVSETLNRFEEILRVNAISLVIIDPLFGFLSTLSCAAEKDARYAMAAFASMAERRNCAVLAIRHLSKTSNRRSIYRGSGSIAYSAAARIVLTIDHHELYSSSSSSSSSVVSSRLTPNPSPLLLSCIKNNLCPQPEPLEFKIVPAGNSAKIEWLGPSKRFPAPIPLQTKSPALREAAAFLLITLGDGPVKEPDIRLAAAARGITQTTLRRAKTILGIRAIGPSVRHKHWRWSLPRAPKTFSANDHLLNSSR